MDLPTKAGRRVELGADEAFNLALTLQRDGHVPEAEALYRRILDAAPEHVDSMNFLAFLCNQDTRSAEAETLISRILEIQPSNADAHSNLGNLFQEQGRHEEAETSYRKALALRPEYATAWNNLAVTLSRQHRFPEALRAATHAVEFAPEDPDYRFNLANALRRTGRTDEAIEAYRQALVLSPRHANARHNLARSLLREGRSAEAAEVVREWLEVDPDNPTAAHQLAALTGQNVPGRASDAYVRKMFDEVAKTFDSHLAHLGYRAPALVAEAIGRELPQASRDLDVLDAGCGTGLCAALLRPYAKKLVGVDLSGGMLEQAAALGLYNELVQEELGAFLGRAPDSFDLVACADTLCYFGRLDEILATFQRALRPGGLLSFTIEDAGDEPCTEGFHLRAHGRYSHNCGGALSTLEDAGLVAVSAVSATLRTESGEPVAGLVVTARKPARRKAPIPSQ